LFAVIGFNPDIFATIDTDVPYGVARKPCRQRVFDELVLGEDVKRGGLLAPEARVFPSKRLITDSDFGGGVVDEL
jgi:hypothetical protein